MISSSNSRITDPAFDAPQSQLHHDLFMKGMAVRVSAFVLAFSSLLPSVSAQQAPYSHGDPTALEQQMLELINRARMNPTQEGIILDTLDTWYTRDARVRKPSFFTNLRGEFATYPAVPPLAFHPKLVQAARAHSQDMITRNFFAHVNPSGQDPTARAAAIGYDSGVGENLDGGGASAADEILHSHFGLMVDYDNIDTSSPLGHRLNVLASSYSEAGVGVAGPYSGGKITQDFGVPSRAYVVGVAYNDANGNGAYDPGEGLAGITVRPDIGNWYAVTSSSGGFAIPVEPVQTVTDTVSLPFAVQTASWQTVLPYDTAYRQQQMQAATSLTVNLTWSGGSLTSTRTSSVTIKRPVLRNFRLTGTDGWSYARSMVTTQNAKADLIPSLAPPPAGGGTPGPNGDAKNALIFQDGRGKIFSWLLDGSGNTVNFGSGSGLKPGSRQISNYSLGDWKVVAFGDLNGDGVADIVFRDGAGRIFAWFLDGSGDAVDFGTGRGLKPGSKQISNYSLGDWRLAALGDLNGDGIPDIIFQDGASRIFAWFLDGSGNTVDFASGSGLKPGSKQISKYSLGDWKLVAASDLSGDGISDIIFQDTVGRIFAWFLDGSGNAVDFASGSGLKPGSKQISGYNLADWKVAAVRDVSGDGTADIVFQNGGGQIFSWYLDGSGNAIDWAAQRGLKPGSRLLSDYMLGDWKLH